MLNKENSIYRNAAIGRNELHANFLAVYLDILELSENIIEAT